MINILFYNNKFKTSNLIISNNSSFSIELLDRTNIVYLCKNKKCIGLTTTTPSRMLTMHLNDSSSMALHLKTHSIPKSKFWKILVEKTTTIAQEMNKLRQQILEALHCKKEKKKRESTELISKIATMFWNALRFFFYVFYSSWWYFIDSILLFFQFISISVFWNSVFS